MSASSEAEHAGVDVPISDLTTQGDGVGHLPGGEVVFVAGALPGDLAQVALEGRRRGVRRGRLIGLASPGPARVEPRCRQWSCGGCPLRALSPAAQGVHKVRHLEQTLVRLAGARPDTEVLPLVPAGDGWGRRHRVRLHAAHRDGRWRLGYREGAHRRPQGAQAVVEVAGCPVVWPELESLIGGLQGALADRPREAAIEAVDLVWSRRDGRGAARVVGRGPQATLRPPEKWAEAAGLSAVDLVMGDGRYVWGNLELRYDHAQAFAFDLRFEPGLFTQASCEVNDLLVAHVARLVGLGPRPQVLELFAGVGNFTAPIARAGAAVVAYEASPRAAVLCRRNNQAPGLRVEVVAQDAARAMAEPDVFDVVVLDPPRGGAGALMAPLARRGQRRIVYVSCDAATLARDARVLLADGWRISHLAAFDMFPQTTHLEAVATFERASAA